MLNRKEIDALINVTHVGLRNLGINAFRGKEDGAVLQSAVNKLLAMRDAPTEEDGEPAERPAVDPD